MEQSQDSSQNDMEQISQKVCQNIELAEMLADFQKTSKICEEQTENFLADLKKMKEEVDKERQQ